VQFVIVAAELLLHIPPPADKGPVPVEFPEKTEFITTGEPPMLSIPPPISWVVLLVKAEYVTVGEEFQLHIPPPPHRAESSRKVHFATTGEQ
jgi:hypothetical protein